VACGELDEFFVLAADLFARLFQDLQRLFELGLALFLDRHVVEANQHAVAPAVFSQYGRGIDQKDPVASRGMLEVDESAELRFAIAERAGPWERFLSAFVGHLPRE